MTTFLRLLAEPDKATALAESCARLRSGSSDPRLFSVAPTAFDAVPGKPFAYWVSEAVRETFRRLPVFESEGRMAQRALSTNNDFRYIRTWWERDKNFAASRPASGWLPFAKGGSFSPFYADIYLLVNWIKEGIEIEAEALRKFPYLNGNAEWVLHRECNYLRPGLTWPLRTNGLSFRAMPAGGIFGHKGPAAFVADDDPDTLLALSALLNSRAFGLLVAVQLARTELAQSYEVGLIQQTPIPSLINAHRPLATLAKRAWSLKRRLDTVNETSHAYVLPAALRARLPSLAGRRAGGEGADYDPPVIEAELADIQAEIDAIAFDLYGFSEADRVALTPLPEGEGHSLPSPGGVGAERKEAGDEGAVDEADDDDSAAPIDQTVGLLSWAVGVVFGRFDWRLATGERAAPPEPEPFDPLPAKSPGMLPDGDAPFHAHAGLLVDDPGHPHDLARLVEEVLAGVGVTVPEDVRRWQRKDFFPFHLQRYSKSRRKAPIYWPLATATGSYTLWLYYPRLTSQTLYIAINDFLEPKLRQVGADLTTLRNKGTARTRDEEKRFEALQAVESELVELRDTLLKLAPNYRPNHDDGVQISAAPLWPLLRHKPWQKVLKDTWARLEKGDYDWAHLAMNYWPERVRVKCKTDKSLAIAHGLEHLYVEPEAAAKKPRGRKKPG